MKVYKIKYAGSSITLETMAEVVGNLSHELPNNLEIGEEIIIVVEEMKEEDFYSLPEWEGW